MKYFRVLCLFIMALYCGSVASHAQVDFHVQVLDPNVCSTDPALCTIVDASATFPVAFTADTCGFAGVPGLPMDPTTYGCLLVVNDTITNFTNLGMEFPGLGSLTFDCPTTTPGSIFTQSSCFSSGGIDSFFFSGGPGLAPTKELVIFETGVNPNLFHGTGDVNETPEPDSLLLLSTGVMMAGLYLAKQRGVLAFLKK
jgi:hypothetical protein